MVTHLHACHCCGQIHTIARGHRAAPAARCARCRTRLALTSVSAHRAASRTLAAATGAFVLFGPAILLPILEVEQIGHRSTSSLLTGTFELIAGGSWFVGGIVLLFSILFPLVKILLLLELSLTSLLGRRQKARLYRLMEMAGRWSMMDVMLLAFLVMLVKLGGIVTFRFGPAVVAFVLCVAMSMIASLVFDPRAIIWGETVPARPRQAPSTRPVAS